jgi:hypothetical protein
MPAYPRGIAHLAQIRESFVIRVPQRLHKAIPAERALFS